MHTSSRFAAHVVAFLVALGTMALGTGCGEEGPSEDQSAALARTCTQPTTGKDDTDRDGLDDNYENCLLEQRAPIVFLAGNEKYLPANVDLLLANSDLRFRHGQTCSSCGLRARPRQSDLLGWQHEKKFGLGGGLLVSSCDHRSPTAASSVFIEAGGMDNDHHFYLEVDRAAWSGSKNVEGWRMYGHVFPRPSGVEVQYWFAFGYSDGVGPDNHQGDWETMATRLDRQGNVASVSMCAHGGCQEYRPHEVTFSDGHPHVFIADGTHAVYPSRNVCNKGERGTSLGGFLRGCPGGGHVWYPGLDPVFVEGRQVPRVGDIRNLGEREHPLYGNVFIKANLKWGRTEFEDGIRSRRDGPVTPSFQAAWGISAPDPRPGVSGGGGGDTCEGSCGGGEQGAPTGCSLTDYEACMAMSTDRVKYRMDSSCTCSIVDGD